MHVAGMRLARRMLTFPAALLHVSGRVRAGAEKVSDAQLITWMRANVTTDQHETGTAAMMPARAWRCRRYEPESVRNGECLGWLVSLSRAQWRCTDIDWIGLLDASIIPFPVSAHMVSNQKGVLVG